MKTQEQSSISQVKKPKLEIPTTELVGLKKEKEVKELQQQRFGTDGDLYKKQEKLIRPIQNLIYNAIQEFAEQGRYGVIFDKSSDLLMLYADENLDKSEKILDYLGYDY